MLMWKRIYSLSLKHVEKIAQQRPLSPKHFSDLAIRTMCGTCKAFVNMPEFPRWIMEEPLPSTGEFFLVISMASVDVDDLIDTIHRECPDDNEIHLRFSPFDEGVPLPQPPTIIRIVGGMPPSSDMGGVEGDA
jgi:hypothetical protein